MHILLVEDDLELGAELQRALSARAITSEWVRQIKDAEAFVQSQSEFPYGCVLLDLGIAGWAGFGFTAPLAFATYCDTGHCFDGARRARIARRRAWIQARTTI